MTIHFLPDEYSRVTQTTVVVPVSGWDPLTDPSNGYVVLPARVEITLRRDEGTSRGDRTSAHVAVVGPRRLKSGATGKPITVIGWERARNEGPRGYVARPDQLTAVLAENLPGGWDPTLLELPKPAVPCMRGEPHPGHLHSGLRKGVAVHGRCPGVSALTADDHGSEDS